MTGAEKFSAGEPHRARQVAARQRIRHRTNRSYRSNMRGQQRFG